MLLVSLSGPDQCGSAVQRSQIVQIRLEISNGQMWAGPRISGIGPNGSISHCWDLVEEIQVTCVQCAALPTWYQILMQSFVTLLWTISYQTFLWTYWDPVRQHIGKDEWSALKEVPLVEWRIVSSHTNPRDFLDKRAAKEEWQSCWPVATSQQWAHTLEWALTAALSSYSSELSVEEQQGAPAELPH